MSRGVKLSFFKATVEFVLLHGGETWTLTKSLNCCYTCMLQVALNVSWQNHTSNEDLFGDFPRVGDEVAARRMRLAGQYQGHPYLPAHKLTRTLGASPWP